MIAVGWLDGLFVAFIQPTLISFIYIFISYTEYKEMSAGINWNK